MRLHTIGFTKKTAREFFRLLESSGARRLIDVRLNNVSQLAGFTKRDDLAFFLHRICGMAYEHLPILAPTAAILNDYKKGAGSWEVYESAFVDLMKQRRIEDALSPNLFADGCLLCSEKTPDHCHRRLVAEYLQRAWGDIEIVHLV